MLTQTRVPCILACQMRTDPDPDPAYHFEADPGADQHAGDPDPIFHFDADPCGSGSTTLISIYQQLPGIYVTHKEHDGRGEGVLFQTLR